MSLADGNKEFALKNVDPAPDISPGCGCSVRVRVRVTSVRVARVRDTRVRVIRVVLWDRRGVFGVRRGEPCTRVVRLRDGGRCIEVRREEPRCRG